MFLRVFWIRPNKNVSRMRITVNESSYKNLLSKTFDYIGDNIFLIKIILFQSLWVSHFDTIDPLWNHDPFSCKFIDNLRYMQFITFWNLIKKLLSLLKFYYPFLAFSASMLKFSYFSRFDWISSTKCISGRSNAVSMTQFITQCIAISGPNWAFMFGFWILTATYLPSLNLALWTCAREADATGY